MYDLHGGAVTDTRRAPRPTFDSGLRPEGCGVPSRLVTGSPLIAVHPMRWVRLLSALGIAGTLMGAESAPPPATAPAALPTPVIRQVGDGLLEVGGVTLDKARRTISFPGTVNQRTGVVEYAIVTTTGKTHESVFRTEAQPQHIHLALLLLGAQPPSTNRFVPDLAVPPPGDPVWVEFRWQQDGQDRRRPLEDSIITTNNGLTLPAGPWIYNGSYLQDGGFVAQREGSIVSIQIDPMALINNPRPGRENDDLHYVNPAALPPEGVPITLAIRLGASGKSGSSADTSPSAASPSSPSPPNRSAPPATPPVP